MKILILGHKGMLGNVVHKYFNAEHEVVTTDSKWPQNSFKEIVKDFDGDYIINCIGWIPQKHTAEEISHLKINYELPIWLDSNSKCRVIHPGTDCEMDDDFYGISKKIASDYLVNHGVNTKIIKTSIIGHELKGADSLLDWFLTSEPVVSGYTNAMWNGNTTLEWAKTCLDLMHNWDSYETENVIKSYCISKYELLLEIQDVYGGNVIRVDKDDRPMPNKCLTSGIQKNSISIQLKELKEFYGY